MAAAAPDVLTLEVPDDVRYLGLAVATVEALALRAGVDRDDVVDLREGLRDAFGARFGRSQGSGRIVLRYEVGDGFLGVRLLDGAATSRGVTS
ncbi:MAG: hypothetical protein ABIV94_08800 [Acidimicrobiales bacterium]